MVASVSTRDSTSAVSLGSVVIGSAMASATSRRPSRVGPLVDGEDRAQEAFALAHDPPRQPEQHRMQQQRDDDGGGENRGRKRPIGRRVQRNAESLFKALDGVPQHGAR